MKIKIIQSATVTLLFLLLSSISFAQPGSAAASPERTALYEKFVASIKGTPEQQKAAYEMGKEFLTKYGSTDDEYTKYIKKWNARYEKAALEYNFRLSLSQKKFTEGFQYGRELLVDNPENLDVMFRLTAAAMTEEYGAHDSEAMGYAIQAIKLIKAGKQPEVIDQTGKKVVKWEPLGNRDDTLDALYFALGRFSYRAKSHTKAITFLYEAAMMSQNLFKTEPSTYILLGSAYHEGVYEKYADEYNVLIKKTPDGVQTPEIKAALEKANKAFDLMIDAYARGVALATDARWASEKEAWMKILTTWYKARHNDSEAGLKELIEKVLSEPLPSPMY